MLAVSPTLPYITLSSDNAHYTDPWILSVQPLLVFHQITMALEAKLADGPHGSQGALGGARHTNKRACARDSFKIS